MLQMLKDPAIPRLGMASGLMLAYFHAHCFIKTLEYPTAGKITAVMYKSPQHMDGSQKHTAEWNKASQDNAHTFI